MDVRNQHIQLKERIKELELQNQVLREKQENRLQEEKARLQAITENVPGVVFQFYARNDGEMGVYYTSPKLYEMFGLQFVKDSPTFLQQFITNIHEEDRQSWIDSIQEVVEKQIPWKWKGRYVKPSGRVIWFEGFSVPTVRKDEIVFDGLYLDITEKKEQEFQRLEIARQQEELKKLDSLKTMARAVAHRFNNSMMAVQGSLELLVQNLPHGSDAQEMVGNASRAASGAAHVGSMMLGYVGRKPLHVKDLSLAKLIHESITSLNDIFYPSVSLHFTPPEQVLYCSADQQQIKEVVENILTNAVESFESGPGTVAVTFGSDYFEVASFPVIFHDEELKDGIYTYCRIEDDGHGISPADLSRIVEPFYTTRVVGRGLGLAMTAGIMRSHHGAITVESRKGKGTTVSILLPSLPAISQQAAAAVPVVAQSRERHLSGDILFADDEHLVLTVGKLMLEKLGFTVHTAVNGQEAVDMVLRRDVSFCAVVLDVLMPEKDGVAAMKAIRHIDPTVPILFCSGYSQEDLHLNKSERYQPDGFMEKPVNILEMQRSLEKVLL